MIPILVLEDKTNAIALKKWHIDVTGDVAVALLLAQIIYWSSAAANGTSRIRIERHGRGWIAKSREEWREEIGLHPKQVDRARDQLHAMGLITCRLMKHRGR